MLETSLYVKIQVKKIQLSFHSYHCQLAVPDCTSNNNVINTVTYPCTRLKTEMVEMLVIFSFYFLRLENHTEGKINITQAKYI